MSADTAAPQIRQGHLRVRQASWLVPQYPPGPGLAGHEETTSL